MSDKKKEFGEGIVPVAEYNKLKSDKGGNKRNKYNAQKTMYEGVLYDSKLEARVAYRLDLMKKRGAGKEKVSDIKRQVAFSFDLNGVHICKYVCDFVVTFADGHIEHWDAKGVEMREGRIKSKLMLAFFGITVKLIKE